jgi:hypothetical protein
LTVINQERNKSLMVLNQERSKSLMVLNQDNVSESVAGYKIVYAKIFANSEKERKKVLYVI